ncbi:S9 family peptidase [Robiginitomaculum antarcticum]|uniref:S9 family peptidase n=1 Tax=Robiginitomaculum antarcticum TaxID=437507 RepID=UPI000371EBA9|nr:S9 family peptidase [Robiginitomaculum antarcticum]
MTLTHLKLTWIAGAAFMMAACNVDAQQPVQPGIALNTTQTDIDMSRIKAIDIAAPKAPQKDSARDYHGQNLADKYFWMKDPDYPTVDDEDVLNYLNEENAYYQTFLKPHTSLVDTLFEEFKGRTDETEESVPYIKNGYEYRWYFEEGAEYRTRARKDLATGDETVFMDETALAEGHDYFVIGGWTISPDNRYLAYSYDTAGDERYQVKVRDLTTGDYLPDVLSDVQGNVEFAADSATLVYALLEKERWHAKNIKTHTLGTPQSEDGTLYTEDDDGFFIGFGLTSSNKYFIIVSNQGEIQESYVIAADLSGELTQIAPRAAGFTQTIDHADGYFYILANDTHPNSRLVRVADSAPAMENWTTLRAGSDDVYLMNLQTFADEIVLKSRKNGYETVELIGYPDADSTKLKSHSVKFPEVIFTASIGVNPEFDQDKIRLNYESMVTPSTVFDYDPESKTLETRKVQNIPSGYDKSQYQTERLMIPARDGTLIPVSIVSKKGFKKDRSHPMWLYGYGAYSATITPRFSTLRLSALDRGFSYAIAHVRGGSMMGYDWYLDGKLTKRTNTFNDFVDVAEGLVERGYVQAGNISASGRSAGGELMGAATIQAPDMWRSVNLGVPFVDVLNTMLDETLPLTPPEWKEWGNPITDAAAYDLIKSYSPYDNIEARDYPPMFVSGGLNDPRVTYWEPAKWTAKMREMKTDDNLLVMRINMGAGHFANSGRYGRLRDYAEEYAFMLLAHGIEE